LALFAALALLFIGCPSPGGDDDDVIDDNYLPGGNPLGDNKVILISGRANSWDGVDVRNAHEKWGNNASGWTANKAHTIVIQGWAGVGGSVVLAEGEKGTVLKQVYSDAEGFYKIESELSWDLINSDANNFRIQGPTTTKAFTIFGLTIKDADGKETYDLAKDTEIAAIAHGTSMTDWSNKVGTTWFLKSGGPTIRIMDPEKSTSGGFVAVTDIDGVPTEGWAGVNLTLKGIAQPAGLITNSEITWSVKDAGTTGATIISVTQGDVVIKKLKTTTAGKATVTATVVNGKSATEDFAKDFEITIKAFPTLEVGAVIFDLAKWLEKQELGVIDGDLADPLVKAGSITPTKTAGGLTITEPKANWAGLDVSVDNEKLELPMDIENLKYTIVVKGKTLNAIAGTKIRLQMPGDPYTMLAESAVLATADAAFELTYEIPMTYSQAAIRIQFSGVSAEPFPEYLIESIKITYEGPRPVVPEYTVTFDSDGGNAIDSKKVKEGLAIGELPVPVKAGKKFRGWFTDLGGAGEKRIMANATVTADMTLKAKWGDPKTSATTDSVVTLIPTGTSGTAVTIDSKDYVLLFNDFNTDDKPFPTADATPDEINGFDVSAGTPRIVYIFPEDFDLYTGIVVTYEAIFTSVGGCGQDGCAESAPACPATIIRKNNSPTAYGNGGDLGYTNLEEGENTLEYATSAFDGLFGFSITKNHAGSAILVRIISVEFKVD